MEITALLSAVASALSVASGVVWIAASLNPFSDAHVAGPLTLIATGLIGSIVSLALGLVAYRTHGPSVRAAVASLISVVLLATAVTILSIG